MLRVMDRYIGKQIIIATIFGVIVLSVLLVMGSLFKELRSLLVDNRASLTHVAKFILSILPFSLIYTLPWGFLVAVLLVFGRLSAANELISMRMAGVGLFRVALPVYVIATILCGACFWLNVSLAPKAKDTMKFMLYQAIKANPSAMLDPGVVQTQFQGQKIFIESRKGNTLYGLHIYDVKKDNTKLPTFSLYAKEAQLKVLQESKQLRLQLKDAHMDARNANGERESPIVGQQEPLLFDFAVERKKKRKPNAMTNQEIRDSLSDPEVLKGLKPERKIYLANEIQRRYAFSFSCLALSLVAVPLGINGRRKETSTGLALSILVGLGYFLFFMIADEFREDEGPTYLILCWLPNIICLILGVRMFFKARRK